MHTNSTVGYRLSQILEHNIADEAKARQGYYEILELFYNELSPSELQEIREIISEELKHSEILKRMIYRRTNIVPEN